MIQPAHATTAPLDLAECGDCRLCDGKRPTHPVLGHGPLKAELVVVGEAPGASETEKGLPFTGPSGRLLKSELNLMQRIPRFSGLRIASYQIYMTNTLACPVPEGETVSPKSLRACQPRLYAELAELNPRVILCMGSSAATVIRGKKSSITHLVGHTEWSEEWQAHLAYTYNPAAVLHDPGYYQDFVWGLHTAVTAMLLPDGPRTYPTISYTVADTALTAFSELDDALTRPVVACDLETTGLRPGLDKIRIVVLSWTDDHATIIPWELVESDSAVRCALGRVLAKRDGSTIVGHNYGFDVRHLWANGFADAYVGDDTMLLHYALDERTGKDGGGAHDLKTLARKYCGAPSYAEGIDRKHMADIPPSEMYPYAAADAVYTYRLYHALRELLDEEPPSREGYPSPYEMYAGLLVPAANALAHVEERGVKVDLGKLASITEDYHHRTLETAKLASTQLGDARIVLKDPNTFNPNSSQQVARVLYTPQAEGGLGYPLPPHRRGKKPDSRPTDEEAIHHLQRWEKDNGKPPNPFLDTVLDYRSLVHTRATYLDGIWELLELNSPHDYRLRGHFHLPGTTSGRLSSSQPNMQNMPARSVIKNMFVARPGYVLCNADYRRLEVGVLAWYSRDPALMRDFLADDFHWNVASKVFADVVADMASARTDVEALTAVARKYAVFTEMAQRQSRENQRITDADKLYDALKELIRRQAKYISFGKMYGEGAESLSKPEKGMGVDVATAQQYSEIWDAMYPEAIAFLKAQAWTAKHERWLETPNGRRRRFGYPRDLERHLMNEAMNFPIQSFASDMCLVSLIRCERDLTPDGLAYPLLTVHDSILFELDRSRLDLALARVHDIMTTVIVDPDIVFEVDMKTGPSWGEAH